MPPPPLLLRVLLPLLIRVRVLTERDARGSAARESTALEVVAVAAAAEAAAAVAAAAAAAVAAAAVELGESWGGFERPINMA
jgi:hypothetical protein